MYSLVSGPALVEGGSLAADGKLSGSAALLNRSSIGRYITFRTNDLKYLPASTLSVSNESYKSRKLHFKNRVLNSAASDQT